MESKTEGEKEILFLIIGVLINIINIYRIPMRIYIYNKKNLEICKNKSCTIIMYPYIN